MFEAHSLNEQLQKNGWKISNVIPCFHPLVEVNILALCNFVSQISDFRRPTPSGKDHLMLILVTSSIPTPANTQQRTLFQATGARLGKVLKK